MTRNGLSFKTACFHFHTFSPRGSDSWHDTNMQAAKTSTFSVESLISKESFAESRSDGGLGCVTLSRERTRTSPSFTSSISIPRPLSLEAVSPGHSSPFSQTSQSPLSSSGTFAISPHNAEHHHTGNTLAKNFDIGFNNFHSTFAPRSKNKKNGGYTQKTGNGGNWLKIGKHGQVEIDPTTKTHPRLNHWFEPGSSTRKPIVLTLDS